MGRVESPAQADRQGSRGNRMKKVREVPISQARELRGVRVSWEKRAGGLQFRG